MAVKESLFAIAVASEITIFWSFVTGMVSRGSTLGIASEIDMFCLFVTEVMSMGFSKKLAEIAISAQALNCSCLNGLQPTQHSPVNSSHPQLFPVM